MTALKLLGARLGGVKRGVRHEARECGTLGAMPLGARHLAVPFSCLAGLHWHALLAIDLALEAAERGETTSLEVVR
jgi:hypothetical protein